MAKGAAGSDEAQDPRIKPVEKGPEDPRIQPVSPGAPDPRIEFVAKAQGAGTGAVALAVPGVDRATVEQQRGALDSPLLPRPFAIGGPSHFPSEAGRGGERSALNEPVIAYVPASGASGERLISFANFQGRTSPDPPGVIRPANAGIFCWATGRNFAEAGGGGVEWSFHDGDDPNAPRLFGDLFWAGDPTVAVNPRNPQEVVTVQLGSSPICIPTTTPEGMRTGLSAPRALVLIARSTDAGSHFGPATRVDTNPLAEPTAITLNAGPDRPDLFFASDGTFWITWTENVVSYVRGGRYDDSSGDVTWFFAPFRIQPDGCRKAGMCPYQQVAIQVMPFGDRQYAIWTTGAVSGVQNSNFELRLLHADAGRGTVELVSRLAVPFRPSAEFGPMPTPVPDPFLRPAWQTVVRARADLVVDPSDWSGVVVHTEWDMDGGGSSLEFSQFQTILFRGVPVGLAAMPSFFLRHREEHGAFLFPRMVRSETGDLDARSIIGLTYYATVGDFEIAAYGNCLVPDLSIAGSSPGWMLTSEGARLSRSFVPTTAPRSPRAGADSDRLPFPEGPPVDPCGMPISNSNVSSWRTPFPPDRVIGDYLGIASLAPESSFAVPAAAAFVAAWTESIAGPSQVIGTRAFVVSGVAP